MIALKDAVETAQTDLRALANKGVAAVLPLGYLSGVLSSLPEGGITPVLLARDACEAIVNCAHTADDVGDTDIAESLRCIVRALSPVVAANGLGS